MCACDWHITELCTFLVVFMHTEGCAFPSLFPCIIQHHCWMSEGRSAVIIRTLVAESNIFSDQCPELCFALRDFADLRHGWITYAFPAARKNGEKKAQKVMQMRVRHRSLLGPINVSVFRSVAEYASMHTELCTIYLYFLNFYQQPNPYLYPDKWNHPLNRHMN